MTPNRRISTRVLMTCAAIAVITGLISAAAGWLSGPAFAIPVLYGLVLTAHSLPGIVAQEILHQRWVALITHVIAALVAAITQPAFIGHYALAVVIMGGVQEGWAAIGRYRRWNAGWLVTGGAILGLVLGLSAGLAIGLTRLSGWGTVLSVVLTVVGGIAWTLVGIAIGRAVRRAGVAQAYGG